MSEAIVLVYQSQNKGTSQDFSSKRDFLEMLTDVDDGDLKKNGSVQTRCKNW